MAFRLLRMLPTPNIRYVVQNVPYRQLLQTVGKHVSEGVRTSISTGTKVLAVGKYVVIGGAVVGVGAFFVSRAGFSLASLAIGAATNVIQHAGSAVTSLANRLNQPASITASMIPDKLEEIPDLHLPWPYEQARFEDFRAPPPPPPWPRTRCVHCLTTCPEIYN